MIKVLITLWVMLVFVSVVGLMPCVSIGELYIAGTVLIGTGAVCLAIVEKKIK